jgi:predicted transcriptional regulator
MSKRNTKKLQSNPTNQSLDQRYISSIENLAKLGATNTKFQPSFSTTLAIDPKKQVKNSPNTNPNETSPSEIGSFTQDSIQTNYVSELRGDVSELKREIGSIPTTLAKNQQNTILWVVGIVVSVTVALFIGLIPIISSQLNDAKLDLRERVKEYKEELKKDITQINDQISKHDRRLIKIETNQSIRKIPKKP